MSSLSMLEATLPPGFRFHPRDEELICDYLMKKVTCCEQAPAMIEVDLNKCEPWDIPEIACVGGREWYFYSQRDRKYATGLRTNRATISGYWKATGKDRLVIRKGTLVGMRKTLVFYQGRAPKGRKTEWVMHEFRLEGPFGPPRIPSPKEDWVLCRVFNKNKSEIDARPDMDSKPYDATSSSSLPPLMDPYISFAQTQTLANNMNDLEYEQVPCFSIFTPNQTAPNLSQLDPTFGSMPEEVLLLSTYNSEPPSSSSTTLCDQKVIKAVLDHLITTTTTTTMKASPSFGEGSSESLLSEVCFPPSMWSHHY